MPPGLLCLQGGGEFLPPCRAADLELARRMRPGPVAVLALAAAPGADHDAACARGARWWSGLGRDVRAVPDARADEAGARAAIDAVTAVVLPGGSPARLHDALAVGDPRGIGRLLAERWSAGDLDLVGCSAGAMVLAEWTVLPDRHGPPVVPALGLLRDSAVVPHFGGSWRWSAPLDAGTPAGTRLVGVPESAAVLAHPDGRLEALAGADVHTRGVGS